MMKKMIISVLLATAPLAAFAASPPKAEACYECTGVQNQICSSTGALGYAECHYNEDLRCVESGTCIGE
jgi:hypothetical protein